MFQNSVMMTCENDGDDTFGDIDFPADGK